MDIRKDIHFFVPGTQGSKSGGDGTRSVPSARRASIPVLEDIHFFVPGTQESKSGGDGMQFFRGVGILFF